MYCLRELERPIEVVFLNERGYSVFSTFASECLEAVLSRPVSDTMTRKVSDQT